MSRPNTSGGRPVSRSNLPATKKWQKLHCPPASSQLPMKVGSAAVLAGRTLYVFGGLGAGASCELWSFDLLATKWSVVRDISGTPPAARHGHSLTWDGKDMLWVFGGQGQGLEEKDSCRTSQGLTVHTVAKRTCFNDLVGFNIKTGCWAPDESLGLRPTPRRGHTACLVLDRNKPSLSVPSGSSLAAGPTKIMKTSGSRGTGLRRSMIHSDHGSAAHDAARGAGSTAQAVAVSREVFFVGGAGVDPVSGTEVVYAQLWILDLDTGEWREVQAEEGPPAPAIFAHTTTLLNPEGAERYLAVAGGIELEGGGLLGGNCAKLRTSNRIRILNLTTLVWSLMEQHPLSFEVPRIHSHTAVEDPCMPGRLLILGGLELGGSGVLTRTFDTNGSVLTRGPSGSISATVPPREPSMEAYSIRRGICSKVIILGDSPSLRRHGHISVAWDPALASSTYDSPEISSEPLCPQLSRPAVLVIGGCAPGKGYIDGAVHILSETSSTQQFNTDQRQNLSTPPSEIGHSHSTHDLYHNDRGGTRSRPGSANAQVTWTRTRHKLSSFRKFKPEGSRLMLPWSELDHRDGYVHYIDEQVIGQGWMSGDSQSSPFPNSYPGVKSFLVSARPDRASSKIIPSQETLSLGGNRPSTAPAHSGTTNSAIERGKSPKKSTTSIKSQPSVGTLTSKTMQNSRSMGSLNQSNSHLIDSLQASTGAGSGLRLTESRICFSDAKGEKTMLGPHVIPMMVLRAVEKADIKKKALMNSMNMSIERPVMHDMGTGNSIMFINGNDYVSTSSLNTP